MEAINGFVAKHGNSTPRAHAVQRSTMISTTFHRKGLEIALPKTKDDLMNSLRSSLKYAPKYFSTNQGTAMGKKFAPACANIFMETPALASCTKEISVLLKMSR